MRIKPSPVRPIALYNFKMKFFPVLCCLLVMACAARAAETGDKLEKAAAALSAQVAQKPEGLEELFDKSLFRRLSLEGLAGVLSGVYDKNGAVTRLVLVSSAPVSGHYIFETALGYRVPVALGLNAESGKISNLFFGAASRINPALAAAASALAALPGRTGLLVRRLDGGGETLQALNENEYFASGAAFKLYVLGALLQRKVSWGRIFKLEEESRSLPAGPLAAWPDGAPLTAHTLAALMLSQGDNTAADALVSGLGRRNIEGTLAALGHSSPGMMRPFLKTSEMFRLRADSQAALKYLNLPEGEKYGFLSSLAGTPLPAGDLRQSAFGLDKIEWPASPADLCRVMDYVRAKDDRRALEILAMNPGPVPAGANFVYSGYRGASEPGVLSMTWLLKDRKYGWYCLSAAWNYKAENLEEAKFFSIMRSALDALSGAE